MRIELNSIKNKIKNSNGGRDRVVYTRARFKALPTELPGAQCP